MKSLRRELLFFTTAIFLVIAEDYSCSSWIILLAFDDSEESILKVTL